MSKGKSTKHIINTQATPWPSYSGHQTIYLRQETEQPASQPASQAASQPASQSPALHRTYVDGTQSKLH